MKQLLLAGTAVLGLVASGLAVRATPIDFTYTGSLVDFTVPATGTYQIIAFGAQGGSGGFPVCVAISCSGLGGRGAEIGGNFILTAGEILQLAVGGAGADSPSGGGGGGGGSFVVGSDNTPLVIAGGGGGGAGSVVGPVPGQGGLTSQNGGNGAAFGNNGGTDGNGGGGGVFRGGGGGGGFFSAGGDGAFCTGSGGREFPDLAGGAGGGGFGGGGGSCGAAGGGGGYSGGGGGESPFNQGIGAGGGGGSFDAGTDQILMADFQTDDGEIIITEVAAAVPEPASLALLGVGLAGVMIVRRRRGRS